MWLSWESNCPGYDLQRLHELGVVAQGGRGRQEEQDHPWLHSEFEASLGYESLSQKKFLIIHKIKTIKFN